jgi:hypothetical protein
VHVLDTSSSSSSSSFFSSLSIRDGFSSSIGRTDRVHDVGDAVSCEALVSSLSGLTALDVPFEVDPVACAVTFHVRHS